jgi:hypothetical protein
MSNPASPIKRKRESSSGSSSKSPKVESSDGKGESKNGGKKAPAKQWSELPTSTSPQGARGC